MLHNSWITSLSRTFSPTHLRRATFMVAASILLAMLMVSASWADDNVQKLRCASDDDKVGYVFSVDYEHNTAKLLSVSGIELKVTSSVGDENFAFEATGKVKERFIINRKDLSFTDIGQSSGFPIALEHKGKCVVQR